MKKLIVLLGILGFLVSSCGGKKTVITQRSKTNSRPTSVNRIERSTRVIPSRKTTPATPKKVAPVLSYKDKVQRYIYEFSGIAKDEMKTYGIPASITLAQGILESGAGYGDLTQRANNHFGIKCHDWQGARVYHDDDRSQECFRKYKYASESFRDHSLFLKNRKRYAKLFTYKQKDYKSWARGLRAAGYATDKKYPEKLISIIERYQLYEFDDEVLGSKKRKYTRVESTKEVKTIVKKEEEVQTIPTSNDGEHIVRKGDTLYSISRRYKITVEKLKVFNNLSDNTIKIGQVLRVAAAEEEEDFN
ncbi:glucosaminidase domain-containing protein [Aquimarina algicola]|uniref:Peptidoglycan hydrolase n=1 Tax=Aquimarina algicola TaxID=2589995 RepID=A0A504JE44_9FLAO|nr:glucosaminidase domain-containing protein [Aquimarina algicola]TPN86715.1 LysM peptidoglycan-binding domain-containing protein [Aquimarina algicola]